MSNLRLINETIVSSTVSSSSITDVFTSDFQIYKVVADNIVTTAEAFFSLRFINASGSIISSNDYDFADLFLKANTSFVEMLNMYKYLYLLDCKYMQEYFLNHLNLH